MQYSLITGPHCENRVCLGLGAAIPQVRSSSNLPAIAAGASDARNANNPYYGDPIYAMPVKPFLSSQDVRNAAAAARQFPRAPPAKQQQQQQQAQQRRENGLCGQARAAKVKLRLDGEFASFPGCGGLCGPPSVMQFSARLF